MTHAWKKYRSREINAGPIDKIIRRHDPVNGDVTGYRVQIYPALFDQAPLEIPKYDSFVVFEVPAYVFVSGMPRTADYLIEIDGLYSWAARDHFERIFEPIEKDDDDEAIQKPE